jgi:hypothetical protein
VSNAPSSGSIENVNFILITTGLILLLACLAGIATGVYMATDPRTREPGTLFAFWWVSGAAAATGVIMRDGVTFLVGSFCFLVAGTVFLVFGSVQRSSAPRSKPRGPTPEGSEKTTRENKASYKRAAS